MSLVLSRADLNALPKTCRKPASPATAPLPFAVLAYAFGQFCLPYSVPVTRRKVRSFHYHGAV